MEEKLKAYFATPEYARYNEAYQVWVHAHGEYLNTVTPKTRQAMIDTNAERLRCLAELRGTPEHKAAFGY